MAKELDEIEKQKLEEQKALEEYAKRQKEADEKLAKLLATPLSGDEAQRLASDNQVQTLKLSIIRRKWLAQIDALQDQINKVQRQIADVDDRILDLRMEDAINFRRTLNTAEKKPAMGEVTGGAEAK